LDPQVPPRHHDAEHRTEPHARGIDPAQPAARRMQAPSRKNTPITMKPTRWKMHSGHGVISQAYSAYSAKPMRAAHTRKPTAKLKRYDQRNGFIGALLRCETMTLPVRRSAVSTQRCSNREDGPASGRKRKTRHQAGFA